MQHHLRCGKLKYMCRCIVVGRRKFYVGYLCHGGRRCKARAMTLAQWIRAWRAMGGSKFVVVLAAVVVMMGVKQSVRLP